MTFEKKNIGVANLRWEEESGNLRSFLDKALESFSVPPAWKPCDVQLVEISKVSPSGAQEAGGRPKSYIADLPSPQGQAQAASSENIFPEYSTSYRLGEYRTRAYAMPPGKLLEIKNSLSAKKLLDRLEPRIEELSQAALEEESEGQLPLSDHSLRGLAGFLNEIIGRGLHLVPSLVLTYEGEIRAEWRHSPDHRLALEFINSTDLEFVFFYPKPSFPEKTLRTSGSGSVTDFLDDQPKALELLRSLNRTSWKSIFFDMYHPHQEKTSGTLGAARPAGSFLGDCSGAGEASRRLVA